MTAPTASSRGNPDSVGIKLPDGYATLVTLAFNPLIKFWEKTVTPPGVDGGDAIEQTTMHNSVWRTMAPRSLKTLTDLEITAAYDPDVYNQIISRINVVTTVTVTFIDDSTIAFYGFIRLFEPQSAEEGTQPEATITITPTNFDPVARVEEGPVIVETSGT